MWTWVSGSNITDQPGIYGTKGVPDPLNVPRARGFAASWVDSGGNVWLFGGYSLFYLNDLWMYDPKALEWTWVSGGDSGNETGVYGTKGISDPSNVPPSRAGSECFIDSSDNLWLFGGGTVASLDFYGDLNDLWKFDSTTLQWTWIAGSDIPRRSGHYGTKGLPDPSNAPGGRGHAVSWFDPQGIFWLFGGYGYDSSGTRGSLNDLWKYDLTNLEWTWVSGDDTADRMGIYGTKGQASSLNIPGSRFGHVSWRDSGGMLWLFGGNGFDSAGTESILNDLWKYDPATLEWTWVSGSNIAYQKGIYGTRGFPAQANVPGSRNDGVSWVDSLNYFWLFGGIGNDSTESYGHLNDLWRFDPTAHEWAWIAGGNAHDENGVYGTRGTAASSNIPGARGISTSQLDAGGKLWLFGGSGYDSGGKQGLLNDLWRYSR
jgi:hypothetical protein